MGEQVGDADEEESRLAVCADCLDFLWRAGVVEGDGDAADEADGGVDDEVAGAVESDDGDAISLTDAHGLEGFGGVDDGLSRLPCGVREGAVFGEVVVGGGSGFALEAVEDLFGGGSF